MYLQSLDYSHDDVNRNHYINLLPSGIETIAEGEGNIVTTDADRFWAAPKGE